MKRFFVFLLLLMMLISITACGESPTVETTPEPQEAVETTPVPTLNPEIYNGKIFLYGELHSDPHCLEKELEAWGSFYEKGMRHLFIEFPYYTAEYLNQWMQADNDDIFEQIFLDVAGTQIDSEEAREFYKNIKSNYPETIFHGTDVGHQYMNTGARFLRDLEAVGQKDSEAWILANANNEQGRKYYADRDDVYRENCMVENFVREFDSLGGADIMGIYGAAHTALDSTNYQGTVANMATQLAEMYGDAVSSVQIPDMPQRTDVIVLDGKEYEASYYGRVDISSWSQWAYREFWRLENAYDDFKDSSRIWDNLPADNYPMNIEPEQVFVISYAGKDGKITRQYFRCDGVENEGQLVTHAFDAKETLPDNAQKRGMFTINGKDYEALYFGRVDISDRAEWSYREFWRLEHAYDDFKDLELAGDNLPDKSYPMPIEEGQVFIVDYMAKDGSLSRQFLRCDGNVWDGMLVTHDFEPVKKSDTVSSGQYINISGKDYPAEFLGRADISKWSDWSYREFWRIDNAYDDFKYASLTGDNLPDNNYPSAIADGQVYVIDYMGKDGVLTRKYFRCDGKVWDGKLVTHEFQPN